jgi:multidrug resistance efflux pump
MQTKKKTLPELEAELQQYEQSTAALEKKVRQHENQIKTILHRANNEKRKIRTHRLIERGAITESLIPNVETLNNEQVKGLLSVALGTSEARAFLKNTALKE